VFVASVICKHHSDTQHTPAQLMSDSLRGFVLRGEVLKLYRTFLRTAQQAPPGARGAGPACAVAFHHMLMRFMCLICAMPPVTRILLRAGRHIPHASLQILYSWCQTTGEVREQIRQGFEAHRGEKDNYARKYLLSDGRAQLKQLRETFMMNE